MESPTHTSGPHPKEAFLWKLPGKTLTLPAVGFEWWLEMPAKQEELFEADAKGPAGARLSSSPLTVTFDLPAGCIQFAWQTPGGEPRRARIHPAPQPLFQILEWTFESGGVQNDWCNTWPASTRAFFKRFRRHLPNSPAEIRIGVLSGKNLGRVVAGRWHGIQPLGAPDPWKWLERQIHQFAQVVYHRDLAVDKRSPTEPPSPDRGSLALEWLVCAVLGIAPPAQRLLTQDGRPLLDLNATLNVVEGGIGFAWTDPEEDGSKATGRVSARHGGKLAWELTIDGKSEATVTSPEPAEVRKVLNDWLTRIATNGNSVTVDWIRPDLKTGGVISEREKPFGSPQEIYPFFEYHIVAMAEGARLLESKMNSPSMLEGTDLMADLLHYGKHRARKEQREAEEAAHLRERMQRLAVERQRRESGKKQRAKEAAAQSRKAEVPPAPPAAKPPAEVPPAPLHFAMPELAFQETSFPLEDLRAYYLRERGALWWVSNQSDDLLCLPHCRIERLEYQVRTALRVLGPLRGRALLSDEVGLGKTIESGLIVKELLTRGMIKRFLILTVPSLVDQWEEELSEKFGLATATTNHAAPREDPQAFWRGNAGIVASLHTLKQPAHLEIARQVHWDMLIVDEAHYLRNRESQAWQAVNVLPRHFLLLLTATPVQNSLEELYNLVTLLQPGQLLAPKEFRARFIDPKRPRQPREPEELRRLLSQVMIRNTRANAGIQLPPRRAETVLFQPDAPEAEFWRAWDQDFRASLARLNASQASLWGRLLLQAAGSSPAAWRGSLAKFPDASHAAAWREKSLLESSWRKKCELIPPIARGEGGAVIFTQFLETQRALAEYLHQAGVEAFVINGAVPAAERQPIAEQFRKRGGALLLTHSGTEGRNLQFSHRLVNFDLPWNPMEIEQRIGRLHRLGQKHPVRIYNLVQGGSLQEHLLEILQEKLNLFELVVGETGLILGDRYGSDEFAEEIFRRWRESEGRVAESLTTLGEELAAARGHYGEIQKLDETLFAKDYESV